MLGPNRNAWMKLTQENLPKLPNIVQIPAYDRRAFVPHTVHIGVGGFHRAHQAVYLDDLLAMEGEPRWGEMGMGVLPIDSRMRDALLGQDCLYTLVEKDAGMQKARVIGSLIDFVHAPSERERAVAALAADETRIVSLTVTEGGYFLDEGTGRFNPDHPDLQRDLTHTPETSIGYIAAACERRMREGGKPFTLMSCDNLQGNGEVVRSVLLGFARMKDPALARWIEDNVAFPNSLGDRSTPAPTDEDRAGLSQDFGIEDAWPVRTEPFLQWVIEDHFAAGRPRWEKVGAEIVADVAPYELMKMRLLNGSHMAMAYLGALAGYTYVHEIMADPEFVRFIEAFMEEVTPVVPAIPGVSVADYKKTLVHRFKNPAIFDQVTRICSEGSAKIPKWLLPSITELLRQGRPVKLLSLVIASWIHYLGRGVDERGRPLDIFDARAGELRTIAASCGADPRPMLAVASVFGPELPAQQGFVDQVGQALRQLAAQGAAATVRLYSEAR